ncbi:hypothetical protein [Actinacidiphila glaucinigra]|uniref:hypothetical protein n=1 Tax=Actinacidiphila glaucinigra TaxID=235986 RepID=UPI003D8F5C34
MAGDGDGGGFFLLAWGLWASVFGWVVATDFRGAARRLHAMSARAAPFGGGRPPAVGVGFVRFVAGVFALVGPVALVAGALMSLRDQAAPEPLPRLPLPFAVFAALGTGAALWTLWRRSGPLRLEWAEGGTVRRAAAVVLTGTLVAVPAILVLGRTAATLLVWLLGGAAGVVLLLGRRDRTGSGPGADDVRAPR